MDVAAASVPVRTRVRRWLRCCAAIVTAVVIAAITRTVWLPPLATALVVNESVVRADVLVVP